ncbi:MAG TPA: FHA domain-containing protein [Chloroflexi bacterium]|jgi:pSer/pThr/pTyr-binding forkhead associated (FHA) protein|nr:FHA domain-containing protein [Chloroflexota bacterium]
MTDAKLIFADGTEFILQGSEVFVGREATNDLTIPVPYLSRHHARFQLVEGGWTVDDMGSTLGTTLNGQAVRVASRLVDGDQIVFGGKVKARFVCGAD